LISYPTGTKVLARYPETTTFYPAEVVGTKRDGTCKLMFEGEEEEGKETEVERRLVLPYPGK
jgi:SAGA-associated factor 29